MNKEYAASLFARFVQNDNIRINEPMKNHTSFKVGGPADLLVIPGNRDSLIEIFNICRQEKFPLFVMGNGTNLIVRDKGIRGVVLKISGIMEGYEVIEDRIKADAGILISKLSKIALEHGLSGLEFAEGIPGTLGGAVTMNAGAYDGEMAGIVLRTEYLDREGRVILLENEQHRFGKRSSIIQNDGGIALAVELKLKNAEKAGIRAIMDSFNIQRRDKQPLDLPSAGSVFKRPDGYFAGKLVQDCGLKGHRIGGAEVSCKHCGFIVNTGNASAADVTGLIRYIQHAVWDRFHIELQTEVKIIGEE